MRKTVIRFFTIADYEEEEIWLREQHNSGWKMVKLTKPCFYVFESCEPCDMVYRLDFKDTADSGEYMQMARDFGWEHFESCMGWLYFRKPADDTEGEDELFSDNASRAEMAGNVVRTRFVPLAVIYLCCVIPNLFNAVRGGLGVWSGFFGAFFGIMFVIYVYLIAHCWLKFRRIREKYGK